MDNRWLFSHDLRLASVNYDLVVWAYGGFPGFSLSEKSIRGQSDCPVRRWLSMPLRGKPDRLRSVFRDRLTPHFGRRSRLALHQIRAHRLQFSCSYPWRSRHHALCAMWVRRFCVPPPLLPSRFLCLNELFEAGIRIAINNPTQLCASCLQKVIANSMEKYGRPLFPVEGQKVGVHNPFPPLLTRMLIEAKTGVNHGPISFSHACQRLYGVLQISQTQDLSPFRAEICWPDARRLAAPSPQTNL